MEYSVVARENPLDRDAAAKFYPKPEWNQEITIRRLSEKIAKSCTLTPADVSAVLESFLSELPDYLMDGHPVRLGDFGILKLSFSATGQDQREKVSASDISNVRVLFRPSTRLKQELSKVSFTKR